MGRINYMQPIGNSSPFDDDPGERLRDGLNSGSNGPNSGSRNSGDNGWIGSIINNAGSWMSSIFSGSAEIARAKTGNYPTVQQDNTPKVLAIAGVGVLVLIIVLFIIFKK